MASPEHRAMGSAQRFEFQTKTVGRTEKRPSGHGRDVSHHTTLATGSKRGEKTTPNISSLGILFSVYVFEKR